MVSFVQSHYLQVVRQRLGKLVIDTDGGLWKDFLGGPLEGMADMQLLTAHTCSKYPANRHHDPV
jgi:hypothetical protein